MKTVARDFTISIEVPDDVKPEDCEIIIVSTSASYLDTWTSSSVPKSEAEISIYPEEPYEM